MATKAEMAARRLVTERSRGVCEICQVRPATDWHHRKNRSQGGEWAASNGLHLCSSDHRWVTEHPAAAVAHGWSVRSWMDPAEVPVTVTLRPETPFSPAVTAQFLLDDEGGHTEYEEVDSDAH